MRVLTAALLLTFPAALAAQESDAEWQRRCERWGDDDRANVCRTSVQRVSARETIRVTGDQNGGIKIYGWDRDEIELHVRVQASARSESRADELADDVSVTTSGTIRPELPETARRENVSATLVLFVPRSASLELSTTNGPIGIEEVDGRIRAEARNGPIHLTAVSGDVRVNTQNGPISVELHGRSWRGAGLVAESQNGPATIYIPEDYNADLETGTVNGPMSSDIPLTVTFSGRIDRTFNTKLGDGGPPVRVVTRNGPASVKRAR